MNNIKAALRKAYRLGQQYWEQADSESYKKQDKAAATQKEFESLWKTQPISGIGSKYKTCFGRVVQEDRVDTESLVGWPLSRHAQSRRSAFLHHKTRARTCSIER